MDVPGGDAEARRSAYKKIVYGSEREVGHNSKDKRRWSKFEEACVEYLWFFRCGNNPQMLGILLEEEWNIKKTNLQIHSFLQNWLLRKRRLGVSVAIDLLYLDPNACSKPIKDVKEKYTRISPNTHQPRANVLPVNPGSLSSETELELYCPGPLEPQEPFESPTIPSLFPELIE